MGLSLFYWIEWISFSNTYYSLFIQFFSSLFSSNSERKCRIYFMHSHCGDEWLFNCGKFPPQMETYFCCCNSDFFVWIITHSRSNKANTRQYYNNGFTIRTVFLTHCIAYFCSLLDLNSMQSFPHFYSM